MHFALLLTEIADLSALTTTIQCSLCLSHMMDTVWGLSVPSIFMMPDGWPYTQCSALAIMPRTLIPQLVVGTGRVVQMKVAAHCSDCCFNWSLEPRPSRSLSQLFFLLPSSRGVLILFPSAARVGLDVY